MIRRIALLALLLLPLPLHALNLLQAYQYALKTDPTYLQQVARNKAEQLQPWIGRSKLLPSLSLSASTTSKNVFQHTGVNPTTGYSLTLRQSILDLKKLNTLNQDELRARQSVVQTNASLQNLALVVTDAYFKLAEAQDTLRLSKRKLYHAQRLLKRTRTMYRGGQLTATDAANANAQYAKTLSQVIGDRIALQQARATLAATIHHPVKTIASLPTSIKLIRPQPQRLAPWLAKTRRNNLAIASERYNVYLARENIHAAAANFAPELDLNASYNNSVLPDYASGAPAGTSATLNFNMPLFNSGGDLAGVRQARFNFAAAQQSLRAVTTKYSLQTQNTFISVTQGKQQIETQLRAIRAQQEAYKDTLYSYAAGQINTQDVIIAENNLYDLKHQYLNLKYNYLLNVLKLKQAAGTLSVSDLAAINKWLQQS